MRLNLSPSVERYVLFAPQQPDDPNDTGVAIWSSPALSHVVEEAAADDALLEFGAQTKALAEASENGTDITPELLRAHGRVGVLLAKAVARLTIERWEGVEDPDGSPAPVTADRVNAFLDNPAIYKRFTDVYLTRWFAVQSEKKGSAPSPTGTSEGAPATAKPARKSARRAPVKSTGRKV